MSPARSTPVLGAFVAVAAFVLLFAYTGPSEDPARGDPLIILRIPEMRADETCTDSFTIDHAYDRMGLSYRFDVAIKPRITLTAPDGTEHAAHVTGNDLSLDIEAPAQGEWHLVVTVDESPGLNTGIRDGEVFMLGFPETETGGTRPSICRPTLSDD